MELVLCMQVYAHQMHTVEFEVEEKGLLGSLSFTPGDAAGEVEQFSRTSGHPAAAAALQGWMLPVAYLTPLAVAGPSSDRATFGRPPTAAAAPAGGAAAPGAQHAVPRAGNLEAAPGGAAGAGAQHAHGGPGAGSAGAAPGAAPVPAAPPRGAPAPAPAALPQLQQAQQAVPEAAGHRAANQVEQQHAAAAVAAGGAAPNGAAAAAAAGAEAAAGEQPDVKVEGDAAAMDDAAEAVAPMAVDQLAQPAFAAGEEAAGESEGATSGSEEAAGESEEAGSGSEGASEAGSGSDEAATSGSTPTVGASGAAAGGGEETGSEEEELLINTLQSPAQRAQRAQQPRQAQRAQQAQQTQQQGRRRVQRARWPRAKGQDVPAGAQLRSAPEIADLPPAAQAYLSSIPQHQLVDGVPDDAPLVRFSVQRSTPKTGAGAGSRGSSGLAAGGGAGAAAQPMYGYFLPRHCLVLARYGMQGGGGQWRVVRPRTFEKAAGNTCSKWYESFKVVPGGRKLGRHLADAYPEANAYLPHRAGPPYDRVAAAAARRAAQDAWAGMLVAGQVPGGSTAAALGAAAAAAGAAGTTADAAQGGRQPMQVRRSTAVAKWVLLLCMLRTLCIRCARLQLMGFFILFSQPMQLTNLSCDPNFQRRRPRQAPAAGREHL